MFAEARFRTPWVDDEFAATISAAGQWLRENPCPDGPLGKHFSKMLGAYAEMTNATVARVMELRLDIVRHVEALNRWEIQTLASAEIATGYRALQGPRESRETVRVPVEGRTFENSTKKRSA